MCLPLLVKKARPELPGDLEDAIAPVAELIAIIGNILCGKPEVARRIHLAIGIVAPAAHACCEAHV